jgi:hypothetical protein
VPPPRPAAPRWAAEVALQPPPPLPQQAAAEAAAGAAAAAAAATAAANRAWTEDRRELLARGNAERAALVEENQRLRGQLAARSASGAWGR